MGRRGVPDRWLEYRPVGERIAGTSFIPFKVPLKETLVRGLPEHERFTTQTLMETVPNVGLVIDLTNTDRYYDCKDFLGQGIRYEKIFCRGHEIPSKSVVDKFFSAVDTFVKYLQSCSTNHDDEKLIGVHCTHGLNRTGYLVCRYMIRRLGFTPEDAIAAFEKARGYPMEREEYLKNLREDENCPVAVDSDMNLQNRSVMDGSRDVHNSNFSHWAEAGCSPRLCESPWTASSALSHSQDMRTDSFRNFSQSETASNFQRIPVNVRSNHFRSCSLTTRADSFTWPSKNNRVDDFNNFMNPSGNVRTSGHPYHWELRTSFDPEERVCHNSRAVSRRFCEQDYEENTATRRRRYGYQHRSVPSLTQDSGQTSSPWRHYHNRDRHYFNHSV